MEGFLTKRNDSKYAKLLGKNIYTQDILLKKDKDSLGIEGVLLIKEVLENDELDEWVNIFLEKDIEIFQAPMVEEFNFNKIESNITNLQIEDLLNRTPIKIENDEILKRHHGKIVLGSQIVSEI
jgi:FlaA1/EpsC-like NDP-sugar epimerase